MYKVQGLQTNVGTSMGNDIHLYHDLQLQTFLIPRLHFLTKGNNCIIAETTICVKPCTEYTTGSSSTFLAILFYSLLFQRSMMGKLKYKNQKETKIYIISTLDVFSSGRGNYVLFYYYLDPLK